jgi:hypothetical protein
MIAARFTIIDGRGLQHGPYEQAQREAERMAAAYPGVPFYVAELKAVATIGPDEAPTTLEVA